MQSRIGEIICIVSVVVVDQLTKALVRATIPLHRSIPLIPDLVDLTHLRNTGAAFGILNNQDFAFKSILISVFGVLALVAIAIYAFRLPKDDRMTRVALALILGGALGNLLDRLMTGSVVDFVDVYWRDHHFWAFNVADSAISIGVTLMFLTMLRRTVDSRQSTVDSRESTVVSQGASADARRTVD